MADTKADKTAVVEEPQSGVVEDSPSSEIEQPVMGLEQPEVSEKVSDQAKAFAQMRQEIKELKSQLTDRTQLAPANEVYPSTDPYFQSPYVDVNQFIDQTTGEFDARRYNLAVNQTIASQAQYNQQAITQEVDFVQAKMAFPTLDATSEEFDPDFEEEVAARYHYLNFVQGKQIPLKQIAKTILQKRQKDMKQEETKLNAEVEKVTAEKEFASQQTPGQSASAARAAQSRQEGLAEEEELKNRTRGLTGDVFSGRRYSQEQQLEATVERLKKIPWIKEEETGT